MSVLKGFNLSPQWIDEERSRLDAEIRQYEANVGRETLGAFLTSRVLASPESLTIDMQVRRYLAIMALLEQDLTAPLLTARQRRQIIEHAYIILKALSDVPQSHYLKSFYLQLKMLESRYALRDGHLLKAAWYADSADQVMHGAASVEDTMPRLQVAKLLLRSGNAAVAEVALAAAEACANTVPHRCEARFLKIKLHRISDRHAEIMPLKQAILAEPGEDRERRIRLRWEDLCLEVQHTGNLLRMLKSIAYGAEHCAPEYVLEATLWARAIRSRTFLDELPSADGVRKAFPKSPRQDERLEKLFEAALVFERCYANDIPLNQRNLELFSFLEQVAQIDGVDRELLVWGAATRWLQRTQQDGLASFAAYRYASLSLALSQGLCADGLSLKIENSMEFWRRTDSERGRELPLAKDEVIERIEARGFVRGLIVAKTVLSALTVRTKSLLLSVLMNHAEVEQRRSEDGLSVIYKVIKVLASLRGLLLKLAQHLAGTSPNLADDVREALLYAHYTAAPLSPEIVREMVAGELGMAVERAFSHWSERPIACGSMRQVHRAVTHDGRQVVTKVQYPGIESVVRADLRVLTTFRMVFQKIFGAGNFAEIVTSFEQTCRDELDYARAGFFHEKIRNLTLNFPQVVVPKILPEFTRSRILTMEYVDGLKMPEFLATADEANKRLAFDTIADFYLTALIDHRIGLSDIHPRSFLFMRDGRVAFIDLGYVEMYPADRLIRWTNLILAVIREDCERVRSEAVALGVIKNLSSLSDKHIDHLVRTSLRLLQKGRTSRLDRTAMFEGLNSLVGLPNISKLVQLPVEDVRLVRGFMGLLGVLVDFGLDVAWADRFEQWLMPYAELRKSG